MDFAMLVARLRLLLGAVLLLTMFAVAPPASAQHLGELTIRVAINRNAEALHDAANLAKCCARW
jgi:hypothetical protein